LGLATCITGGSRTPAEEDPDLKRHVYLNWVADTEVRLQEIFSDAGIEDPVPGRGYPAYLLNFIV
jgi:hypothetical protein